MDDAEKAAAALETLRRAEDAVLAASPLRGMEAWVTSGRFPDAAAIRGFGFREDSQDRPQDMRRARGAFTRRWGFSIPCAEAVAGLVRLSPLVEVGAGTGYWSCAVKAAGGDVVATDLHPAGGSQYAFGPARWTQIEALGAVEAVRAYPDRNVFCSWPSEQEGWMAEAARAMRPGRCLALIGYDRGGVTGDEALFDLLDEGFEPAGQFAIPQFPGKRDRRSEA